MTDPYEVLNIPNTATDDEVKKAYRALARKYHPDNYHDNPLADLAQEKMKEINAAYDAIQRERSGHGRAAPDYGGGQQAAYQYYGQQRQNTSAEAQILYQVRWAVMMGGSLEQAERLLAQIPESGRGGEWSFLMGQVYYRRGWVDEARRHYQTACAKDPGNAEYRNALDNLNQTRAAYRPDGYGMSSTCSGGDLCGRLACTYLMCNLGGCFWCC
ncbi:MAG: DnaJ domain-containing protein [Oscillospiraceae bacterium]|nr:DnaJ domain-containing protein [Oscillospiraceae bacterium]